MTRAELIATVVRCADDAGLIATDRDAIVRAVSDPSVKRVARGDWEQNGCLCPASLAGLADPFQRNSVVGGSAVDKFATLFDDVTREGYSTIIEIED